MSWIEFIGVPGAGKSTIIDGITESKSIVNAYGLSPYRHFLRERSGWKSSVFLSLPESIQCFLVDQYLSYRVGPDCFDEFLIKHPEFSYKSVKWIKDTRQDTKAVLGRWRRAAQRHIMGRSYTTDSKVACFDEGIYQQLLTISWHYQFQWDGISEYIHSAPTPSLVVLVNAPWETCLDRQKARGSVTINKSWVSDLEQEQRALNEAADQIYNYLETSDVPSVRIENSYSVESAVETTLQQINNKTSSEFYEYSCERDYQ